MNLDTSSQEPHKLTPMEGLSVLSNQIYPCQSVVSLCCRLTLVLGELAFLKFFLKLYMGSWRDGLVLAEDQCSIPNTLMEVHNCPKTSYKIWKMWKSIGLLFFSVDFPHHCLVVLHKSHHYFTAFPREYC